MTHRRLALLIPVLALLVVLAGVAFWPRGGDAPPAEPLVQAIATGPDVPPDDSAARAEEARLQEEAERERLAREEEAARQHEWEEAIAAALAVLRQQDETVAADAIRRWGPERLLLALPSIGITAATTPMGLERDGRTPATPNSPWDVAWYNFTDQPGAGGNAVFSGHVDWYTGAPAVFGKLKQVRVDDPIYVVQADGNPVVYQVASTELVEPDRADVQAIFGSTEQEAITFITCGGTWNAVTKDYSHRLIVRAYRVR